MPIILSANKQKKIKTIKKKMIDLDLTNGDIAIRFDWPADYVTRALNGNCYVSPERFDEIYDALEDIHKKKYKVR